MWSNPCSSTSISTSTSHLFSEPSPSTSTSSPPYLSGPLTDPPSQSTNLFYDMLQLKKQSTLPSSPYISIEYCSTVTISSSYHQKKADFFSKEPLSKTKHQIISILEVYQYKQDDLMLTSTPAESGIDLANPIPNSKLHLYPCLKQYLSSHSSKKTSPLHLPHHHNSHHQASSQEN